MINYIYNIYIVSMNFIIIFYSLLQLINAMDYNFSIAQYPSLDTLNCRSLTLTFSGQLESIFKYLTPLMNDLKNKQLVQCYLVPDSMDKIEPQYDSVIVGGTFDFMHIGHQILLLTAIMKTKKKMMIGVTGQKMLSKKKNKQLLQSIQYRKKQVQKYVKKIKPELQLSIEQINDPFGRAIIVPDYQAIVVSAETIKGGQKINEIRRHNNLEELHIEVCGLISQNNEIDSKLSSSSIREYLLKKNKTTIQQFSWYKKQWYGLNDRLAKYLKVNANELYTQTWWNRIITQYSEYWRFYHTNSHIFQLLDSFEKDPHAEKLTQLQFIVVSLAIWFHDVEYIPSSKNNQELSAQTAVYYLKGLGHGELKQIIEMTKQSIIATKIHKTDQFYIKLFLDLDMQVLDFPRKQYGQYANMIKLEYLPVAKQHYNVKRVQFLKSLNPQQVFYLRKPLNLYKNIEWEIEQLAKQKTTEQL